ncbi:MAG: DUF4143 domain-containing protein [Erysipelotrichaceae bacterium]|jgi:predicted AAA+ superfamily ATPase
MENEKYRNRLIDWKVDQYLQAFGAVCIQGPKWCGKTWTSEHHAESEVKIQDPAGNYQNRRLANESPSAVLQGARPRLIDEWQDVPSLWDAVRAETDRTGEKGQFILTGSSTPLSRDRKPMHSGAGRIARLDMHTMSLYEAGFSDGRVSLQDICMNKAPDLMTGEVTLDRLADYILRGGWPENTDRPLEIARLLPQQYINAILGEDVSRMDNTRRDLSKMNRLLCSLARNESTTVSDRVLQKDISDADGILIDRKTISDYLDVYRRLFLISDTPAYSSSMRSSVRVKQQSKRHLCDPSLSAALMHCTMDSLMNDLNTMGFLFEALVERDLAIYAEAFDAHLYHYQDYKNREIDAVIELEDGSWCGFEIKLGASQIQPAVENLKRIQNEFAADEKAKQPRAMCVICGLSRAAYYDKSGIYIVPLTSLKD